MNMPIFGGPAGRGDWSCSVLADMDLVELVDCLDHDCLQQFIVTEAQKKAWRVPRLLAQFVRWEGSSTTNPSKPLTI